MRYGFIKVCSATPKLRVADVNYNADNIIDTVRESAEKGAQLVVFPELSVCGYTCGDLFNQSALLEAVENAVERIKKATAGIRALVFVGAPVSNSGRLYNCAVAISGGKILAVIPKTFLPNYGEFYEKRNFCRAPNGALKIDYAGEQGIYFGTDCVLKAENYKYFTVSAEICEDLWAPCSPSVFHAAAGANIIVNLSCSNETIGKADYRRNLIKVQSAKLACGYVYSDAGMGESTTDLVFAGHNIICENGKIISESPLFEGGFTYGEIDVELLALERQRTIDYYGLDSVKEYTVIEFTAAEGANNIEREFSAHPFIPTDGKKLRERAEQIISIQAKALQKRLEHTAAKTAVIGISGGLDSALALLVARRAFIDMGKPLSDIIAITMPGFGTTSRTKNNSLKLIEQIGATSRICPITDSVLKHFEDIGHDKDVHDVTYENAQARMRTMILMDVANKSGGLVIGTGDLSELALGWATFNGDHMSMYGVNSSVPKTLVKYLVKEEAEIIGGECGKVLKDIVDTEISPELLPPDKSGNIAQKTEDLVGPYELHDFFLYYAIRYGFAPEKIKMLAISAFKDKYNNDLIEKWLKVFYKRFFSQQFKRSCVPDGVKVGSVALSPRGDWRMPSDAVAAVWLDNLK